LIKSPSEKVDKFGSVWQWTSQSLNLIMPSLFSSVALVGRGISTTHNFLFLRSRGFHRGILFQQINVMMMAIIDICASRVESVKWRYTVFENTYFMFFSDFKKT